MFYGFNFFLFSFLCVAMDTLLTEDFVLKQVLFVTLVCCEEKYVMCLYGLQFCMYTYVIFMALYGVILFQPSVL